jgi:hypothetical protein
LELTAALTLGCTVPVQTAPSPPLAPPHYDYTPAPPCDAPGSAKLTVAVVSPQSPAPRAGRTVGAQPGIVLDIIPAMRDDFFELMTCRGYLTRGPFGSFEAMVYPDREGSQLLLEPELQIAVTVSSAAATSKNLLGQTIPTAPSMAGIVTGSGSIGGRVALTLKEPITNTRMWTRSIEVPATTFAFTTEKRYSGAMPFAQLRYAVLDDEGLRRVLQPNLEAMYLSVLKTAESYLNRQELATVARQAVDVRKKAAISVPPRK